MITIKEEYLEKVKKALGDQPNASEICDEISSHIAEAANEKMLAGVNELEAHTAVLDELGEPSELANCFCLPSDKKQKTIYFILLNWCFFLGGILLTVGHHVLHHWGIHYLWMVLENLSLLLLLSYSVYWVYVGFYIGKQFGPNGKRVVNRTIFHALIPNFVLMMLVLFDLIPRSLFSTLLSPTFLIICVIATILFYPIGKIAYKFGILQGL